MDLTKHNILLKVTGIVAIISTLLATFALLNNLNFHYSIFAYLCGLGLVSIAIFYVYFTLVNIHTDSPKKIENLSSENPDVAVIIPIYNEDISLLEETVKSVIEQDYPLEKIKFFIANDAHREDIETWVNRLPENYPGLNAYHVLPPEKESKERQGDAKAGALNAAWEKAYTLFPDIEYIETRDCDDSVGDPQFLKKCTSYLMKHPDVGLVQTYKETELGDTPDPFDTREVFLQSYTVPGKIWLGGIFALGSGVVYRHKALIDSGGFDAWNIIEDVTTSAKILQQGWASQQLDIIGVSSQAPVTDLENFLKQRSVWSLDALRLLLLFNKKGLTFSQKLSFCTKGIKELFYPTSILLLTLTIGVSLIVGEPIFIKVSPVVFVAIIANTLFELTTLKGNLWFGLKHKNLEAALIFVNLKMIWVTLINGKEKKPKYVVTRKTAKHESYLRYCGWHIGLLVLLIIGILKTLLTGTIAIQGIVFIAALYWSFRFIGVINLALYRPKETGIA